MHPAASLPRLSCRGAYQSLTTIAGSKTHMISLRFAESPHRSNLREVAHRDKPNVDVIVRCPVLLAAGVRVPPGQRTPEQIDASFNEHKGDFDDLLGDWADRWELLNADARTRMQDSGRRVYRVV
jgi:hypothetical protein